MQAPAFASHLPLNGHTSNCLWKQPSSWHQHHLGVTTSVPSPWHHDMQYICTHPVATRPGQCVTHAPLLRHHVQAHSCPIHSHLHRPLISCQVTSSSCSSSAYDNPALYTNDDQFSEASYWDARYRREPTAFEWYRGYASLRPLILAYLPPTLPVIQLGVGTSTIQHDMVTQDGYTRILNVDYAAVCVDQQQRAHVGITQLEYAVADARDMGGLVQAASFGGVLDKGTLDALLCGESDEVDAALLLHEACRVLEPGGVYLHVTHAPPKARLRYLQSPSLPWASIEVWEVGQQGRSHGPYHVHTHQTDATTRDSEMARQSQRLPEALEAYSHWVYACRKRIDTCGLQDQA